MNSQPDKDLQRQQRKLETETNFNNAKDPKSNSPTPIFGFAKFNLYLERFLTWFNSLSGIRKLATLSVVVLLTLVVVQTIFKLVAAVISLAVLTLLVYVGYKFFVSSSFPPKQ